MSVETAMQRLMAPPPRNVGGGDLATRVVATAVLIVLVAMVAPQAHVPYVALKLSLLVAAELGLVSLMLGLFLRTKTYFAGIQLFLASLAMLWIAPRQPWVAIAVGLALVVIGIGAAMTRRSRLNAFLEINSLKVPLEEVVPVPQGATP